MCCSIGAAGFRPSSRAHDAGLSPCARNTIREAISRDTPSSQHAGHAVRRNRTRSAAGTFSGHRQVAITKLACPRTLDKAGTLSCSVSATCLLNESRLDLIPILYFDRSYDLEYNME